MTGQPTVSDAVRDHVRRVLEADKARHDIIKAKMADLERDGHRIVSGGQTDGDEWAVTDWRTGETIAQGGGGYAGYIDETNRLDPGETWFDIDRVHDGIDYSSVPAVGIPQSFGDAIEDWTGSLSTSAEDIAEVAGWPVEKVRECLDDAR